VTADDALHTLLEGAGLDPRLAEQVSFVGDDPVYPTRYRIGRAAAVAIAAIHSAAWPPRQSARPLVVDVAAAAVSTEGFRHLYLNGTHITSPRDVLTGFYATRDGRQIFLHLNFPHHRMRIANLLGTFDGRDQLAFKISNWQAGELEDAIANNGACAQILQSPEMWRRSAEAQALNALPPVEIIRIGDSAPEAMPSSGAAPLDGLSMVDCTRVLAGPICGRTLADLGARVLRIENPLYPDLRPYQLEANRDKQRLTLDLRLAQDMAQLRTSIAHTDVFSQAYRSGVAQRLGFDAPNVAALRPGIVMASLNAFGHLGPSESRRGFDSSIQAAAGLAWVGEAVRPVLLPTSPIDYVSGYLLAFGVLVALHRRAHEGGSYLVRASLARTAMWIDSFGLLSAATLEGRSDAIIRNKLAERAAEFETPEGLVRHLSSPTRFQSEPVHVNSLHAPAP
jgi:hypothetical protein